MKLKPKSKGIQSILDEKKWRVPQLAEYTNMNQKTIYKMLKEEEVLAVYIHYLALAFKKPIEELTYNVI